MKFILSVSIFLLSFACDSQSRKFTFKIGSEYSLPRKTEDLAFLANERDGIVNLSLKKEELNIVRFDPKTLNITTEKVIELPEATKNFNSETVVELNDNYFWLHSNWEKDTETEILYFDKIDVVSGKITDANHKLFESSITPVQLHL